MSDVLPRLTTALESRYRVSRQIGTGGMATVYLAHDLRHERDVAIKVLHPDLAAALGADRFLAEIKTTAKLQHPHVLPLLDSGDADGLLYYVMPYIAGESLRDRLDRETQLAVDEAVSIAREVLSALESAHKHGVVHRDIKPENILLQEDHALVADFGIALAVSAAGGARMTQTGLSLGTPAYMAPEQAMGERVVDGRADIYALGAVLYEMLVGEAPFTGPTVQAIVARVMTESPRPVTGQRKSVPAHVNAAVLRALEKLPADRFHSAAEFSTALGTPGLESTKASAAEAPMPLAHGKIFGRSAIPWAIAGVAVLAASALAFRSFSRTEAKVPIHLAIDLLPEMELPPGAVELLGISDDGLAIAMGVVVGGRGQLVLRRFDEDVLRSIPGAVVSSGSAAFSADGKWLAYGSDNSVFKVPVAGGPPTKLASSRWAQMTWIGNQSIVYTKNYDTGLYRTSSEGTDSASLTTPDRKKGELGHWWPQVLPDGDHIVFTNYVTPADRSKIEVLSLKSGKRQVIFEGGYFGRYVSGHLLFVRNEALFSIPFDASRLKVKGTPVPVPLDVETNPPSGFAGFAVAPNGTLVYRTDAMKNIQLSWVDETGNEDPAIDSAARFTYAVPSPDGRRIAVVRDGDVWVYDTQRRLFSRLTRTEQREESLLWSPDSREVIYTRDVPQYDIFRRTADGSTPEALVATSGSDKTPMSVSPDGTTLLFGEATGSDQGIFATPLHSATPQSARSIIGGPGDHDGARFSPDGQWITFSSSESGRAEIYLVPYPLDRGPVRQQLSDNGGIDAYWGPDGRTVYYSSSGRIYRIRVNPRTAKIGRPELLSKIRPVMQWRIGPDGRFLVMRVAGNSERRSVKVILNWASTLESGKN